MNHYHLNFIAMALDQFNRSLPIALHRALDAVMPRFRRIFNESGITEQQWRVLRVLLDSGQTPLGNLAKQALIPGPSLVGVIDRLARAGLVTRERDSSDRRIVLVSATPAGRRLIAELMPRVATAYADLKRCVDSETWEAVLDGLERISKRASTMKK